MMKFFIFVFVCIKMSTGYYEELAGYNFPSIENSGKLQWPLQVYYGEPQMQRKKPCPHRRSNDQAEQWVPSFRSTVTKTLNNNVLEPQALKSENVEITSDDESKLPETLPAGPVLNKENNTATDSDPNNVTKKLERPNRRSNVEESPNNSNEQSLDEDYDCDIDSDAEDYFDLRRDAFSVVTSEQYIPKNTVGIEQKVIEMLKDCINKKQKYIEDKILSQLEIPLAGSRRSMGDNDVDTENNDSDFLEHVEDTQATTDPNENTTEVATNESYDNTPDKVYKIPSFTLRPGKLFNELKNPTKATGIAKIPVSRRMQEDNSRVCYACSSATNPTCWEPDSKTTIKYCRIDQNCITKTFGVKNTLTVVRDCADSCDASSVPGIEPKYKSCSMCYKDLCNGAAINSYNLLTILLITSIKYTFSTFVSNQ